MLHWSFFSSSTVQFLHFPQCGKLAFCIFGNVSSRFRILARPTFIIFGSPASELLTLPAVLQVSILHLRQRHNFLSCIFSEGSLPHLHLCRKLVSYLQGCCIVSHFQQYSRPAFCICSRKSYLTSDFAHPAHERVFSTPCIPRCQKRGQGTIISRRTSIIT